MGKEVLSVIPRELGLRSSEVLENNVLKIWHAHEARIPQEVVDLRNYIDSIA